MIIDLFSCFYVKISHVLEYKLPFEINNIIRMLIDLVLFNLQSRVRDSGLHFYVNSGVEITIFFATGSVLIIIIKWQRNQFLDIGIFRAVPMEHVTFFVTLMLTSKTSNS